MGTFFLKINIFLSQYQVLNESVRALTPTPKFHLPFQGLGLGFIALSTLGLDTQVFVEMGFSVSSVFLLEVVIFQFVSSLIRGSNLFRVFSFSV